MTVRRRRIRFRAVKPGEPDPIPAPRGYAHALLGLFVVGCFFEAVIFAGRPWAGGGWNIAWMPAWGWDLRQDTLPTLLAYFAAALVLYGISRGGQGTFTGVVERNRVRRTVGTLGALLAMCAASLGVLAVAATFRHPTSVPALVVVVPMTSICWVLGVESSRFVVPRHARQFEMAVEQLERLRAQIARLPRRVPVLRRGLVGVGVRVAAMAAAGAGAGALGGGGAWQAVTGAAVSGLLGGVALLLFGGMTASSVVEPSRGKRAGNVAGAYVFYVFLVLLGAVNLLVVAPQGWWVAGALLLLELVLPLAFHARAFPSKRSLLMQDLSLRGTLIAYESRSLHRSQARLSTRIDELQAVADIDAPSGRERVREALLTLLGGTRR